MYGAGKQNPQLMGEREGDKLRKPFFSREKEKTYKTYKTYKNSRFPKKSECRISKILKVFFGEKKEL